MGVCIMPQVTQLEREPRRSDSRQARERLGEEGIFELEDRQEPTWGTARRTVPAGGKNCRSKDEGSRRESSQVRVGGRAVSEGDPGPLPPPF